MKGVNKNMGVNKRLFFALYSRGSKNGPQCNMVP